MKFCASRELFALAAIGLFAFGVSHTAEAKPDQTAPLETAEEIEPHPEFADLPAPYQTADYNRGRRLFRQCSSCHLIDENAGNLVGPNLYGMFGSEAGSKEGFKYSKALAEADFTWTPEALDEWLASPRTFLPGNRMTFNGIRRDTDREAVIAYLMANTGWKK